MTPPRVFSFLFAAGAALLLVGVLALCGAAMARVMFPENLIAAVPHENETYRFYTR